MRIFGTGQTLARVLVAVQDFSGTDIQGRAVPASQGKRRTICVAAGMSLVLASASVFGRSDDRTKLVNVASKTFSGYLTPNSKTIIRDRVTVTQGSLKATGTYAELYVDATSSIVRVVLKGNRAHVEELDDEGKLITADADLIDYNMTSDVAILTGNAQTFKKDTGTASADHLTYNLDTGELHGTSVGDSLVHMTIIPKQALGGAVTPGQHATSKPGE